MLCSMYGCSRTSSFGLTIKLVMYQPQTWTMRKQSDRRHRSREKTAYPWSKKDVCCGNPGTQDECSADDEQSAKDQVIIGVGYASQI